MSDKLLVAVLGNRDSGKSTTWNSLFRREVKTGSKVRPLALVDGMDVDVFLVNGSPQERDIPIEDILGDSAPTIVLCSLQYVEGVMRTVRFFSQRGYSICIQWINPGHHDAWPLQDTLGLMPQLLHLGATVSIRDGKGDSAGRVREIRDFVWGWALSRGLVRSSLPTG